VPLPAPDLLLLLPLLLHLPLPPPQCDQACLALLLGSDYTEGVAGIGVVNALEVVCAWPGGLTGLAAFRDWLEGPEEALAEAAAAITARRRGQHRKQRGRRGGRGSSSSRDEQQQQQQQQEEEEDGMSEEQVAPGSTCADTPAQRAFKRAHRGARRAWALPPSFPSGRVLQAYSAPLIDDNASRFVFGRPDDAGLRSFCRCVAMCYYCCLSVHVCAQ
jgi:hypothetical protein